MSVNETLNSELPIEKLINLGQSLNEDFWQVVYPKMKNESIILNPNGQHGPKAPFICGIEGVKGYLVQCEREAASAELLLREMWARYEYHARINGQSPLNVVPHGDENIVMQAVRCRLWREETFKLRQVVRESELIADGSERDRRMYNGVCKRRRQDANGVWQISEVDGRPVDENGMLMDHLCQDVHIDQYLADCLAIRKRNMAAKESTAAV